MDSPLYIFYPWIRAVSSPWLWPPDQLIFFEGLSKEALGELTVRRTLRMKTALESEAYARAQLQVMRRKITGRQPKKSAGEIIWRLSTIDDRIADIEPHGCSS